MNDNIYNNNHRKLNGKKQWTPEELLHHFKPVYNSIFEHPRSGGFIEEVDPEELGIPDYFDIIKNPIALCTILKKLHEGTYKNPWEIVNDFWLMFNNCILFNKKSTPIYKDCLQLIDIFIVHASNVMKYLGFCCANMYFYEPKLKSCGTSKNCLIKNNCVYYKADSPKQEFLVCEKCYCSAGDIIELNQTNKIAKTLFIQMKNDEREDEKFIQCTDCGRDWHVVCALYRNDGNEFLCEGCRMESTNVEKYRAAMIPASSLSKHIEHHVNNVCKKLNPAVTNIIIRDFINKNNMLDYQPKFKERYPELSQSIEYTSRAIYAFTEIDGVDVMFFGIHSQEYSPNINGPNKGCVNITYLDSVSFFQPSSMKTIIYQHILMSYLDYIRRLDITNANLWVCPPEIGNDYIFHRHPTEQKLPKKDRLKAWYESVFQLGLGSTVLGFENIVDFYRDLSIIQPTDIPYFDGDFWPTEIETLLIDIDKEIECQMNESLKQEKLNSSFETSRKRKKKSKGGPVGKKRKIDIENVNQEINIRFNELLKKWGDDFIVVKLMPLSEEEKEEIGKYEIDKEIWSCEVLETRDRFLPFCKDFNLEFSTLRRIKYSTMNILYEIMRENKKNKIFCNICHITDMKIRYFCKSCIDFDLCDRCYRMHSHDHEMYKEQSKEDVLTIEQYAELVYHVFNCNNDDCSVFRCDRVKTMKKHIENCITKNCRSCKNMVAALMNHSRFCEIGKCNVYSCKNNRILKETHPNILPSRETVSESPNPGVSQPLLSSTPKSSLNTENIQPYMYEIMTEICKLKSEYPDSIQRNRAFAKFMKERPYLDKAYLLLKEKLMKKKENEKSNTNNLPSRTQELPALKINSLNPMPFTNNIQNIPNNLNQNHQGIDTFFRRDIQTTSIQNTAPQMIRHPKTNQLIPVRTIFPQTDNHSLPQSLHSLHQTQNINQTQYHFLPQTHHQSLNQTQNYSLSHNHNPSINQTHNHLHPQIHNQVLPPTNNHFLPQEKYHIYIKSEPLNCKSDPNKSLPIVNNVPNIHIWSSQQQLNRPSNVINANTKIVIKSESAVHKVGVVRINPRDNNLIRIDPSKSTRVTSEIPLIRIIKP